MLHKFSAINNFLIKLQIFKVTIPVLISCHCLAIVPMTVYIDWYSYKIILIHILVVASAVQETISGIG